LLPSSTSAVAVVLLLPVPLSIEMVLLLSWLLPALTSVVMLTYGHVCIPCAIVVEDDKTKRVAVVCSGAVGAVDAVDALCIAV
jgi:hypothetical protein